MVTEQDYRVPEATKSLGIAVSLLYLWKAKIDMNHPGLSLKEDERDELKRLHKEVNNLRKEGYTIGCYRVRKLMQKLNLLAMQRLAYMVTTNRRHSEAVADNLLNMNFNPVAPNQIWAGDVIYLKTGQGWMYQAIVIDLYSRRIIVGLHIDNA